MNIHEASKDPFPCPKCDKIFKHKNSLTKHLTDVHGKLSHICPVCHKKLANPRSLKVHVKTHNKFNQPVERAPKMYSFENERCDKCEKRFKDNGALRVHQKGVHGAKEFQCKLCNYQTSYAENMKKHVKGIHNKP